MKAAYKMIALPLVAVLLVALGVAVSFWAFRQIEITAEARKHTYEIINRTDNLLSELKDAETGQRGYALTGDTAFLDPYLRVRDSVAVHLQQLRELTLPGTAAQKHLDVLAPLVDAKLAELAEAVALRRHHDMAAVLAMINIGQGKRLMDAIRAEMNSIIQIEESELAWQETEFQSNMRRLFTVIVTASLFTLLVALLFAYVIYQESRQRLKNLLHLETRHLLEIQEETNKQLRQTNAVLQVSEEKLAVTLNSIGDAVIATDAEARVTLLNPVAELLTGWTQADAAGRKVDEVFHIINQETREASTIPVMEALAHGTVQGLANHTVLIARGGSECAIADSCAPIRDRDGQVVGAVLVFRDVSGEYVAQQALRDSAAQIQTILNAVVDGIITVHPSGVIETVNPATERMFGYSAAELVGGNFSILIPELDEAPSNLFFEYQNDSDEQLAIGLGREVVGQRKDGSLFTMEMSMTEMWLGGQRYFTGILRDITLRNQAAEALRWAEESFRLMVESVTDYAIVMLDPLGRIVSWNSGAQRIKGYSPEEIIGRHFSLFYPYEDIACGTPQRDLDVVKAQGRFEAEGWRVRKDGSAFWANVIYTAIRDQSGNLRGFAKLTRDLTERKRLDQVLQDKNAELESAKLVAEKANLAKSEFLSSMSHELRTPLNAILGFAQLLEAGVPPPTAAQIVRLQQIIKAGWYLLDLINEILDLALIESGRLSLSKEPVSLMDVMLECRAMIEPQAQQRDVKLSFLAFDNALFAYADRTRVKQVLINLLSNAIKYNREHGMVEVRCIATSPERLRISIKDSGVGLSPDKLEQLFQPFNRLGQETGIEEGTGIGLVVTKQLVELMGGSIGVTSIVDVGSEFWIELIRDTSPRLAAGNTLPLELLLQAQGSLALHTLLYVEDNPANLMLVEQIIADHSDINMLSARDGILGIALAHAHRPDVILMDINLPGINGIEALKILREDPVTAHIPVIALSANAMPRDIEKGMAAGFFRYLTKPIKVNEFMNALDDALMFSERGLKTDELIDTHETGPYYND